MKPVRIPRKVARELRDVIADMTSVWPSEAQVRHFAEVLDKALAEAKPSRGVKAARKTAKAKKAERNAEWARIREGVLARASGECEACFWDCEVPEVDHFFGGSGRRYEMQAEETCWALCPPCHRAKTLNRPDAASWLRSFIGHCGRQHGAAYVRAAVTAQTRLDALELAASLPMGVRG